jgi:hypothetical protein
MRLEKIKEDKDEYLTKYVFLMIKHIKKYLHIPQNRTVFHINYKNGIHRYLYENMIISVEIDFKDDNQYIDFNNKNRKFNINILNVITMLKSYPQSCKDVSFKEITKTKFDKHFYINEFLDWIDSPCVITANVDLPYYKILKFLQEYKKTTFASRNYIFYSKKDQDYTFTFNLYAKNLKNNSVYKLYVPEVYIENEVQFPTKLKDILIETISGSCSIYEMQKCKKEFLNYIQENCSELNTKNLYAMQLVKQAIQPVEEDVAWMCHRVFSGDCEFTNIWLDDYLNCSKNPYFFLTDKSNARETTRVAILDMQEAKYVNTNIYKQGIVKFKHWELSKDFLTRLSEFLRSPYVNQDSENENIETNWQKLIYEYNYNIAQGYYGNTNIGLPLNLPVPDYSKINLHI